eukprot:m.56584 g.56584  ORF g.56584 m.56584 type:complete len:157 (-) comp48954_c0_seq3:121-591(-)
MATAQEDGIDISQLTPQNLLQLKQQIEQELTFLTDSVQKLRVVQQKFINSRESLHALKPESLSKEILVPMTGSLYVTGTLAAVDKVTIDIGTGYFMEKTIPEAIRFFDRKIEHLKKNIEQLQPVLMSKHKDKTAVEEMLESKLAGSQQAARKAQTA